MDRSNSHQHIELARLFFREIMKISENNDWSLLDKIKAQSHLLEQLFIEVTRSENIQFTTLFARISFACHQFHISKRTQYWIHFFRNKTRAEIPADEYEPLFRLGIRSLAQSVAGLFDEPIPDEVLSEIPRHLPYEFIETKVARFLKQVRVVALQDDEENACLLARDESNPGNPVLVKYNIADRNTSFNPTIRQIRKTFGFPVTLSLLEVEVDESGTYYPKAFVVEPDYLLDVSAIAYCFQGSGAEPIAYLLNKFLPSQPGIPLILGNVANFFLDELMHNPMASFRETFPKVFKTNPLTFSLLPDSAIKEIYQKSQKHWVTLQMMVNQDMQKSGIAPSDCYLEPSFYDAIHGLQGRLDIFYKNETNSAIIELKSGKPFMANKYGIGVSHYIQTLLYDLMVKSVYQDQIEPTNYILYSGLDTNQLRYAPPVKAEQQEALKVRNQLVAIDRILAGINDESQVPLFQKVQSNRFAHIKGYLKNDIELFEKTYRSLNELERIYFNAFAGFIAREHHLAKTGIQGVDNANGLASLWLDSYEEKERNYQILKSLQIRDNYASEEDAIIVFDKTAATSSLANFRTGDIAVLYPERGQELGVGEQGGRDSSQGSGGAANSKYLLTNTVLTSQIFKVSILEITNSNVTVRLRYKQFNKAIFEEFDRWNLEPDQMDMGYYSMYQGLFRFAQSLPEKRALLLTARPPTQAEIEADSALSITSDQLTEEQASILTKMLSSKEYFLLWGPPGTGKTSQMLKNFAGWIFDNTDENLLLIAYTNRAVDEICEALEGLGEQVQESYLRIGSTASTDKRFADKLLTKKIGSITRRNELKEILSKHRIFVSTLASLSNNTELLSLKKFRRIVIDEASQILEPMLVGLLPHFEQFILIGDHKQLPAVVVQSTESSKITNEHLKDIGLHNLRNSLFERLYMRCVENGWHWAYDHLSHQGRMHEDIMRFPGDFFYEGKLKILPATISHSSNQTAVFGFSVINPNEDWEEQLSRHRLHFIDTPIDSAATSRKTNMHEAQLVVKLVQFYQKIYPNNQKSIGIITPYRAQIAQIQGVLKASDIEPSQLTVDTVERYQGGARDIILISLCTNAFSQIDALVSLSEEGIDRKLNVALTRAKEHVVVLGNEKILAQSSVYRKFIHFCRDLTAT